MDYTHNVKYSLIFKWRTIHPTMLKHSGFLAPNYKRFGDKIYATYSKITERKNDKFVLDPARNLLKLYLDEQFETLNPTSIMFENKEDCQNYCDWLNLKPTKIE